MRRLTFAVIVCLMCVHSIAAQQTDSKTTLETVLNKNLSVKEFGTKGDGSADDTVLTDSLSRETPATNRPAILFLVPAGGSFFWIDFDYLKELQNQGFEVDYTDDFSQLTLDQAKAYNTLVVFSTPSEYFATFQSKPYDPSLNERFIPVVEDYLRMGGGVLLMPMESNMTYQSVSALANRWDAGIPFETLLEKDSNRISSMTNMPTRLAYTDNVLPSPVSEGVHGIWYPYEMAFYGQQTLPLYVTPDWQVVIRGSPSSVTVPNDLTKSAYPPSNPPFTTPRTLPVSAPPLFVIRGGLFRGAGRVALTALWPLFSVSQGTRWLYNREVLSKGLRGIPSDFGKLLKNTLSWLAEPSFMAGTLGGHVTPPDRLVPPNLRAGVSSQFDQDSWHYDPTQLSSVTPTGKSLFKGLIGVKSLTNPSNGSVKDYAQAALNTGLHFLVFTEDFETLTQDTMHQLVADCNTHSTATLKLFAGFTMKTNIGNRIFFFGPSPVLPTGNLVTGTDHHLFNLQSQGADGSYTGDSNVIPWLLKYYHTTKGQVGYYSFSESPRGMHMADLRGFGMVALRYYRNGVLVEDFTNPTQAKDYLTLVQTTMSAVPASFNEVTSPAQITQEVASGHALTYALASSLDNIFVETLRWNDQHSSPSAFVSDGPLILSWAIGQSAVFNFAGESFLTRRSVYPSRLLVSAPSGLKEIDIYNGTELFRRMLFHGEQQYFQTFVLEDTVQRNLVVIAIDQNGKRAVSFPRRSWKADSLAPSFCSDHYNDCRQYFLMAHGPFQLPVTRPPALPYDSTGLTWDGGPEGRLYLADFSYPSPILNSSLGIEDGFRFNQASLLDFSDEGAVSVKSERTEIFDSSIPTSALNPGRAYGPKDPSLQMNFTLTYQEIALPSLKVMDFGSPLYGHREGINASLFAGTITFKQRLTVNSLQLLSQNVRPYQFISSIMLIVGSKDLSKISTLDLRTVSSQSSYILNPGDWFAVYSPQPSNSHLYIVSGKNPLRLDATNVNKNVQGSLGWLVLSAPTLQGVQLNPGNSYTFELLSIGFPMDVKFLEPHSYADLVRYLTLPTGLAVNRGTIVPDAGFLTFNVGRTGALQFSVSRPVNPLNLSLPVRVEGLNSRWSAGLLQIQSHSGQLSSTAYRALGTDAVGNSVFPVYVNQADASVILAGHPIMALGCDPNQDFADKLFIQVTRVIDVKKNLAWHVSVNNPTDRSICVNFVKNIESYGLSSGFTFSASPLTFQPGEYRVLQ